MTSISIVIEGAGGVGKSALTTKYVNGTFLSRWDPTIEDSYRKMTEVDGKVCMLELIDTAGQEGYSSLRDNYSLQSDVLLLVYSISSFTSFEYLQTLFLHSQRLLLSADKLNKVPIIIVGNKNDLEEGEREVEKEIALNFASKNNLHFFECSAKSGENINEIFIDAVRSFRDLNLNSSRKKHRKNRTRCSLM